MRGEERKLVRRFVRKVCPEVCPEVCLDHCPDLCPEVRPAALSRNLPGPSFPMEKFCPRFVRDVVSRTKLKRGLLVFSYCISAEYCSLFNKYKGD